MNRMKNFTGWLAGLLLALAATTAMAQAQLLPGRDFTAIDPAQPTDTPTKVEVLEFFSYGCPHCKELNPVLGKWAARQPADVVVRRVPVSFGRPQWANLSKLYFALEATGDLARLDDAVFAALHEKGLRLYDERAINEWVAAQGVDMRKFADAFGSFGVAAKVRRADQMVQTYRIDGVPALTVDGKYRVLTQSNSHDVLLAQAERIIAKARSERGGKK
ncbi:thiol:disulfide interchange protein DsbA/DsbL [Rhodocyclus tenuis]|uniref:Thiol:disulfide interchange protein n=1 Tax=Rhodocyclus tenuis TaxID=1066 RepID=A0A840GD63_RHOTE|nr:thiol:disulfide interchange protein DsbA/DsbL [Rhodocyclus tenuis]MBB4246492.1 thiol:disulfide interchange protein DsbA [Rhodocyclus tenuis]